MDLEERWNSIEISFYASKQGENVNRASKEILCSSHNSITILLAHRIQNNTGLIESRESAGQNK
jgi:hypothetical protein